MNDDWERGRSEKQKQKQKQMNFLIVFNFKLKTEKGAERHSWTALIFGISSNF